MPSLGKSPAEIHEECLSNGCMSYTSSCAICQQLFYRCTISKNVSLYSSQCFHKNSIRYVWLFTCESSVPFSIMCTW